MLTKLGIYGACRAWDIDSGPPFVFSLQIKTRPRDSHDDVIYGILLSRIQFAYD